MSTASTAFTDQADPWGAQPRDWAEQEDRQIPTYQAALNEISLEAPCRVLDIGCGAGTFLRLASERGADVAGLDASEALLDFARTRIPSADLRAGDMEALPFADAQFDLVTGFNSFFFAADMAAALSEAARVTRPGGEVLVQVWGPPERCELTSLIAAARGLLSENARRSGPGPALWAPGVLEERLARAGLRPRAAFDVTYAFSYRDSDSLRRSMLSAGGIAEVAQAVGEEATAAAILRSATSNRAEDGSYRLSNRWHFAIGRKP